MPYNFVSPYVSGRTGTLDTSQFTRTGSPYTNPDFLKMYMAQIESQSFNTLFGEEGLNDSIFGSSGTFGGSPSNIDQMFGGMSQATMPSDLSGLSQAGGANTQYIELVMKSYLVGKIVEIRDPQTGSIISGKVGGVMLENGALLLDVDGKKIPPEYLIKISSAQ